MSSPKYRKMIGDLKRNQDAINAKPRFLLCFEDAKSAPDYFEAYRVHYKLSSVSFIVDFNSSVTDPLSVVKYAIELRDKLIGDREFEIEDGDQVWALVDVDRHETMRNAIQLARDKNIKLSISNPCFEYWLLLHFEDSAKQVKNCSELISRYLKKKENLPNYEKGSTDFSKIVSNANKAAERAKRKFLEKAEPDPVKCCPCTQIYELINMIQKHIE